MGLAPLGIPNQGNAASSHHNPTKCPRACWGVSVKCSLEPLIQWGFGFADVHSVVSALITGFGNPSDFLDVDYINFYYH